MVIIGLLYLFFEYQLLRNSALDGENPTTRPANPMSRIMIGVQVRPLIPHTTPSHLPLQPPLPQSTSALPRILPTHKLTTR
jgi:hypothetical protein